MNLQDILQLIAALAAAAPTLAADTASLIKALTSLLSTNPSATAADIQATITNALNEAQADDKQVEGTTIGS